MVALKGDKEIGDKINKIIAQARRGERPQGRHRPGRLQRRREARHGQGDAGPALEAGGDLRRSRLPRQPRRGRRPPRRRLRVPDAALRHRESARARDSSTRRPRSPASWPRSSASSAPTTRRSHTVYDPTCGSGSLLLKVADEAATRHHHLRPGEGRRHLGARADEHDPARPRDRRASGEGNTLSTPHFKNKDGSSQDLRLRRRQSAVLGQGLDERARPGERLFDRFELRRPAGQERRLRLPAARHQVAQEHGQGRDHPAARRALPRQRRGRRSAAT